MGDAADDILDAVAARTGVTLSQLRDNATRHRDVVTARVIATGLLDECAKLSTRGIGRILGTSAGATCYRLRRWRRRRLADRRAWLRIVGQGGAGPLAAQNAAR